MNKKMVIIRTLETLLQLLIVPCCIIGDWASTYQGLYGIEYRKDNFLDAAVLFDSDFLATIIVAMLAVTIIILIWTRAARFAFIPAMLQLVIFVKTLVDYFRLSSDNKGHVLTFGYIHTAMVVCALILCVWAAIEAKHKAKNNPE